MKYDFIGKVMPRPDAYGMVSGETVYGADRQLPGMLYVKAFHCPEVHCIVKSLDVEAARRAPGVVRVATAEDIPGNPMHGINVLDQPILVPVGGTVRLQGDPLAFVAAETEKEAEDAVRLITATYERLEPIVDMEIAALEETPPLHPGRKFAKEYYYEHGDLEQGFAQADEIVEMTFTTPRQEHAYIETEACISYYDYDGILTVYGPSHEPFNIRNQVARALNVPTGRVRAIVPPLGGSFGGKQAMTCHIEAALMTYLTKRPVQCVWSREEALRLSTKRHPARFRMRMGAKRDGHMTAFDCDFLLDAGAYVDHSPGVTMGAGCTVCGPYYIPNIRIAGRAVLTNNPVSGAFRGYGGPQASTAQECLIHKLARKLKMDPAEFRRINAIQQGQQIGNAMMKMDCYCSLIDTIDSALKAAGARPVTNDPDKRVGRGIGCAIPQFDVSAKPYNGLTGAGAEVEMLFDGSFQVRNGAVEMGTGIRTALAMLVAQEMCVPMEQVDVILSDTALTPKTGPTVASRAMYTSGNAVKNACGILKERLSKRAAKLFSVDETDIGIADGAFYVLSDPDKRITYAEFAPQAFVLGENMVAYNWFVGTHAHLGHTFMTTVADVEVDIRTGAVRVLQLSSSHDIGKAINPMSVYGQLAGGAVQGLGWTVMENLQSDGGKVVNGRLSEYYIPTMLDIPDRTHTSLVECPYPTGPYGVKGVGEHALYSITPAILNAIEDATGVQLESFPANAENVWRALNKREGSKPVA